jgi:RimJ/RimL family protein N-acetyltransferase
MKYALTSDQPVKTRICVPVQTDFPCLASLRRNAAIQHLLLAYPPKTAPTDEEVWAWIERRKDSGAFFTVAEMDGAGVLSAVGFVQLHDIHRAGKYAYFGVAIDEAARGRGHAFNAVWDVMKYGRRQYGLHKVLCEVRADNSSSLRLCQKLHFERIGTLKNHYLGYDVVLLERALVVVVEAA